MAKKATSELRKTPRVPVNILIQYQTPDQFFQDYIKNVSLGGLFIETESPLPVGTKLNIPFSLPEMKNPIITDGIVVHAMKVGKKAKPAAGGMGIRFSDLNNKCKQSLESYLQRHGGLPKA